MNKVVVISGATGMSGCETVKQLLKKDYIIIAFDNFFASSIDSLNESKDHKNLFFFEYDINNDAHMNSLEKFVLEKSTGKDLYFINYAAVVHTKYFYSPESTFQTNVLGMKKYLDLAIRLKASRFINCSTSEVYSMNSYKEGGVKEDDVLALVTAESSQRTSYATGKLMTEFFMKEAIDKNLIKGCSIRFANVYSNDELFAEHIIPYTIDSLMKSNTITLFENAKNTFRTFLHNYDSCSGVISLLEAKECLDGTIYNIGTEEEIAIVDLVKLIASKMNISNLEIKYQGVRSADPVRRLLNTDKIRAKTAWTPKVSLEKGIEMCLEFKKKLFQSI